MSGRRLIAITCLLLISTLSWGKQNGNLALKAHASASESQENLTPEKAIDGNTGTRWSGIPGHNSGIWFELKWDAPVEIAEILVRQYDRYTFEWDVQTWDDSSGQWTTANHYGKQNVRLPGQLICPFDPPKTTTRIRIASITNGPSFTEVEVYGPLHRHLPVISLASDLRGNFVGMLSDSLGVQPIPNRQVTLTGNAVAGPWRILTTSDEHGMFFAQMPIGLRGIITAIADGSRAHTFNATGFQPSLIPHSSAQTLSTGWKFALDPLKGFEKDEFDDKAWKPIKVPAHWEMEGHRSLNGVAGYRLKFTGKRTSERSIIRFDGVYSGAEVWLNGFRIAMHEGGFTPFEADVTDYLVTGDNVLALRVTEHTNVSDNLDKMSLYADFPLGGIIRKVTLFNVPIHYVESFDQSCRFEPGNAKAIVSGQFMIANRSNAAVAHPSIQLTLKLPNGRVAGYTAAGVSKMTAFSRSVAPFTMTVPNPKGWSAEHPNLYTLHIELRDGAKVLQSLDQMIGLRQTEIKGSQILINGTPVKFKGTCHHDSHPLMGRAVTPELTKKDLTMIKEANLNSVRTSHYPPIPELVEQADQLGI